MTIHQFNNLDKEQQLESIWHNGFIIGERENGRYSFILYRIDTFYVELRYFQKSLRGFQVFEDKKQLLPYSKKPVRVSFVPRLYTRSLYQLFYA